MRAREESLGLYDLESCSAISLSSLSQWKRRWLSDHAVQARIPSTVVCHLWKNLPQCSPLMTNIDIRLFSYINRFVLQKKCFLAFHSISVSSLNFLNIFRISTFEFRIKVFPIKNVQISSIAKGDKNCLLVPLCIPQFIHYTLLEQVSQ